LDKLNEQTDKTQSNLRWQHIPAGRTSELGRINHLGRQGSTD